MMIRITMTATMMMMTIRMIIILIRIMMTDYEDTTTATTNNNNNNSCCYYYYSTDTESRNSKYFTISSTCNENCLQHVCSCDHGAIARKSRAVYQTHITCNMSCATWYEGTTQLLPFGIVEISFIVGLFYWLFNR